MHLVAHDVGVDSALGEPVPGLLRPRWYDASHSRVGHQLAHVLIGVDDDVHVDLAGGAHSGRGAPREFLRRSGFGLSLIHI